MAAATTRSGNSSPSAWAAAWCTPRARLCGRSGCRRTAGRRPDRCPGRALPSVDRLLIADSDANRCCLTGSKVP